MKIAFRYKSSKKMVSLTGIFIEPKTEYDFNMPFKEARVSKLQRDWNYRAIQIEAPNGATVTLLIDSLGWVEDVFGSTMVKTPLGYFASIKKAAAFFEVRQEDLKQWIRDEFNNDFKLVKCSKVSL
jgi:hypothetical protein